MSGAAWPNWGIGRNSDDWLVASGCTLKQGLNDPAICLKLFWKAQLHCQGVN